MKQSFIPKDLRPDVPGQYYTPEEAENTGKTSTLDRLISGEVKLSELKDVKFRKEIITALLSYQGEQDEITAYKAIFSELYPQTAKVFQS